MQKIFILLFSLLLSYSSLKADERTIYDIRGNSWLLDANMTIFLGTWRTKTVEPIQHGIYKNVIVNGNTSRKEVCLTFDDAPDQNNTSQLLDILKDHGVKAAFFMIGGTMNDSNATVVKRAFDEGHLVLNHSFNHPRLTNLSVNDVHSQLDRAGKRIESLTGYYPLLMRPPYGSINSQVIDTINSQGLTTVLWSLDSLDWTLKDADAIADNVTRNVRNGDIILMHRNRASVAALSKVIETLKKTGYSFERLDKMLGLKPYR